MQDDGCWINIFLSQRPVLVKLSILYVCARACILLYPLQQCSLHFDATTLPRHHPLQSPLRHIAVAVVFTRVQATRGPCTRARAQPANQQIAAGTVIRRMPRVAGRAHRRPQPTAVLRPSAQRRCACILAPRSQGPARPRASIRPLRRSRRRTQLIRPAQHSHTRMPAPQRPHRYRWPTPHPLSYTRVKGSPARPSPHTRTREGRN